MISRERYYNAVKTVKRGFKGHYDAVAVFLTMCLGFDTFNDIQDPTE
jgi:hypothetical protein